MLPTLKTEVYAFSSLLQKIIHMFPAKILLKIMFPQKNPHARFFTFKFRGKLRKLVALACDTFDRWMTDVMTLPTKVLP